MWSFEDCSCDAEVLPFVDVKMRHHKYRADVAFRRHPKILPRNCCTCLASKEQTQGRTLC